MKVYEVILFILMLAVLGTVIIRLDQWLNPIPDPETVKFCQELAVKREHAFAGTQWERTQKEFQNSCEDNINGRHQ